MALKRQQAAEDAIALSMAKVATGQKLNRLPPGKIFGMSVTDPNPTETNVTDQKQRDSAETDQKDRSNDVPSQKENSVEREHVVCTEIEKPSSTILNVDQKFSKSSITALEGTGSSQRYRNLLFNVNKTHAIDRPEVKDSEEGEERREQGSTVSQASVQTLANLFPSTKLSVLQLVLQRCGQDLLKAIEYFASQTAIGGSGSAFRPVQNVQASQSVPNVVQSQLQQQAAGQPEVPNFFAFPQAYSNFGRNIYGDGYCLLNIVPEQLQPKMSSACTTETANLTIAKSGSLHEDSVALNVQYNNYFNSNIQHLREHMCNQMIDPLHRQGLLHLPPIIPGIPCVQPNCSQCYKFP